MIFQYYLFLLIASLSELYFFRFNNTDHLISKIFSSILLLICNIIIVLCVCLIFSTKIIEDGELQFKRRRCIHCFSGLKERRISRFYTLLFFLRRQLFCVLILLFKDIKMIVKLSVYSLMQLVYIVILCFHRPFKYSKELIIDLINEFVYLSLCVLLIHFNTENAWNSVTQNLYIWIIIGNNIVLLIFEIVFCFKCKKRSKLYKVNTKVEPKVRVIDFGTTPEATNKQFGGNESAIKDESDVRFGNSKFKREMKTLEFN